MIINFEELRSTNFLEETFTQSFKDRECTDALLQSVNYADVNVSAYVIDGTDLHISLKVSYNFNYLDAVNLDELVVNREFEDEVLFTNNQDRADEMDIDFFIKEVDVSELVFQLILVDIPFNYSEQERTYVDLESLESSYNPFADLI